MESNYHIHSDINKNNQNKIIETTSKLSIKYELPDVILLKENDIIENHPLTNNSYSKLDKELIKTMFSYFIEFMRLSKLKPLSSKQQDNGNGNSYRPQFSVQLNGEEKLRCIINNYSKALELSKYCCVGFFGIKQTIDENIMKEIITSDDALVSILPEFPSILGYVTIQKEIPIDDQVQLSHLPDKNVINYANIVIIENFEIVNHWRNNTVHRDANQYLSPLFYHLVRIHNLEISIPSNLNEYFENGKSSGNDDEFDINLIRTKYYSFSKEDGGKVNLRAMRLYNEIKFTSFLSPNAFEFYSQVVESIGKNLNLSVKMIDIYSIIKNNDKLSENEINTLLREEPHKLMIKYGIDYAFMCSLAYSNASEQLVPLVSPIRIEDHYNDKPIYFSYLIGKKDMKVIKEGNTEISKDLIFGHNGKESYSGYQIIEKQLLSSIPIEKYFNKSIINTGSHLNSIKSLLNNEIDIASIDSTVFDTEILNGSISLENDNIKILKTIGPSTAPPLVAKISSPHYSDNASKIQDYLTSNQFTLNFNSILSKFNYKRFEKVNSNSFNDFKK